MNFGNLIPDNLNIIIIKACYLIDNLRTLPVLTQKSDDARWSFCTNFGVKLSSRLDRPYSLLPYPNKGGSV